MDPRIANPGPERQSGTGTLETNQPTGLYGIFSGAASPNPGKEKQSAKILLSKPAKSTRESVLAGPGCTITYRNPLSNKGTGKSLHVSAEEYRALQAGEPNIARASRWVPRPEDGALYRLHVALRPTDMVLRVVCTVEIPGGWCGVVERVVS